MTTKIDETKIKKEVKTKEVKETKKEIVLRGLNISEITIDIVGTSPLLMDKLPKDVADSILAKQAGVSNTNSKKIRDTKQEIQNAIHVTSTGKIGFPVCGFKSGIILAHNSNNCICLFKSCR